MGNLSTIGGPPEDGMNRRVLVVEDDASLRGLMRDALAVEGFDVLTATSVAEGLAILTHAQIGLMLLDLGLPDGDGRPLLAAMRARGQHPVIVVSARHHEAQKVALLDAGADDYLTKPFGMPELLARVRVALRHHGQDQPKALTRYVHGALKVDLTERSVLRDGATVHLTPTEFALMACLVRHAGRVVTHRQLLREVWGAEYVEHTHYLRLYMAQLRSKLEPQPAAPQHFLTEPGVGYRLAT